MKKETIILEKYEILRNYGRIGGEPNIEDIMNKIIEFSKDKNILIYKHAIRYDWQENINYESKIMGDGTKIPRGDETIYLDIYYQDK